MGVGKHSGLRHHRNRGESERAREGRCQVSGAGESHDNYFPTWMTVCLSPTAGNTSHPAGWGSASPLSLLTETEVVIKRVTAALPLGS